MRVVGDERTLPLRHRLTNGLFAVVAVTALASAITNVALGLPAVTVIVTGITGMGHVGLFLWSRVRRELRGPLWVSFGMLVFALYPAMWLGNFGLDGGNQLIAVGLLAAAASLMQGRQRAFWLLAIVVVTVLLFTAGHAWGPQLGSYGSFGARAADNFATTVIIAAAIAALNLVTEASYRREREKAREYAAVIERTNRELEEALERNRALALTDAMTALPNRRHAEPILTQKVAEGCRYGRPLSVAVIDVDHFKSVNDRHGHAVGDAVLTALGRVLSDVAREADVAARWGGEEFVVICPETSLEGALVLAERVRKQVEGHRFASGLPITVSIGVAERRHDDTAETLFERADAALYRAKRRGRNRVASDALASSVTPSRRTPPARGRSASSSLAPP